MFAAAALALVIRAGVAFASRYTSEDYMITLRYAENLAQGHGMVYNVGEHVLGTTTPLYTLLLALAAWSHLSPTLCGKTANVLADGALCALLYLWLRHEGFEKAGRIAAFLAAVHPLHFQWAISGMETSLVTAGGVWAWYACARRSHVETYVILAILFLLRWDSVMLTAAITLAICWRERRAPLKELVLFFLLVSPWLAGATETYGSPIPITGHAKMVVYGWFADHLSPARLRREVTGTSQGLATIILREPTWLLRRLPMQQKLLNVFIGSPGSAALTAMAIIGWHRVLKLRRWALMPAVIWLLAYLGAFLLSRVLLFNWYLVPPFPIVELLAAIGAVFIARRARRAVPKLLRMPILYALLTAAAVAPAVSMAITLRGSQQIEEHLRIPIGRWLDRNSRRGDRVILEPIGYIGYYSHRPVIDVIGLVSPQVLAFYSAPAESPWLAQIIAYKPEWCVLRPQELDDIERASSPPGYEWRRAYTLARTFSYSHNRNEPDLVFHVFRRNALSPSRTP